MAAESLRPLVGDLRQIAAVRGIVLDDGAERGVRALAFSTGGGLDFWVLADRSLDLGTLSWRGVPLAWQSPGGFRAPALIHSDSENGHGFNRGFSGFLVTCGLNHIRQPAGGQPLHGRFPFTPARLTGFGEDWERETPVLFCEGEVVQSGYGAESLKLRRRIEAPVGGASIRITDSVENLGAEPVPQGILYHFNLGFPGIAPGTVVELDGEHLAGPLDLPSPGGLATARSWAAVQAPVSRCVVTTPTIGGDPLRLTFAFATATLGHLQLWHDLRPRVGVLSVEPCTSARPAGGPAAPEAALAAGERRDYRLEVSLAGSAPAIPFADASSAGESRWLG